MMYKKEKCHNTHHNHDNISTVLEAIENEGQQQQQQQQQHQPLAHDGGGGCGGARKKQRVCPRPKLCTIRQSAGQENVKPPAEKRRTVAEKSPLDYHRQRISELTLKLAALNSTDNGRTGSNNTMSSDTVADPPAMADDYRVTSSSGRRGRGGDYDDDDCGRDRGGAGARPARSAESRAERQLDSSDLLCKRSELRSMLDFTGECFEEVSSMLRSPRKDPKSATSLAQVYGRSANSHDDDGA